VAIALDGVLEMTHHEVPVVIEAGAGSDSGSATTIIGARAPRSWRGRGVGGRGPRAEGQGAVAIEQREEDWEHPGTTGAHTDAADALRLPQRVTPLSREGLEPVAAHVATICGSVRSRRSSLNWSRLISPLA
jgi:hypothetical protein